MGGQVTMEVPMRCYVCDAQEADNWHRPTYLKDGKQAPVHSESTVQVCKSCGSVCHDVDPAQEEKIKQYYRKEYRPQPTILNLITTTHKLNYIRVFLKDWLKSIGDRQLSVGDVGAATGYLLNFFRQLGHKVSGSELTLTYRRMSEHYYGIPLAEELESKHRYDLIAIYHVLEHLVDPDKKLAHYASLLAEGGRIMVATPEWFGPLEEASGTPTNSFDNLFHKNHINLFSETSIKNLFRKCGLSVVSENHVQYGQTYLLERTAGPERILEQRLTREDWRDVTRSILSQRAALEAQRLGRYRDALALYPNFPEAWLGMIFNKATKDLAKQVDLFSEAEGYVGGNLRFVLAKAQWHYQQGRLAEAIEGYQRVLSLKPNEDTFMFLGYALAQCGRPQEAIQAFQTAQAMDPRKWQEVQSWILAATSNMPAWDERALEEARKALPIGPLTQPQAVA